MMRTLVLGGMTLAMIAASTVGLAWAEDDSAYTITIENHRFTPEQLELPARKKLTLTIKNLDPTPAEFESSDLNREKVVVGGGTITVFIGPLRPGSYEFFDDFNPDTPHGNIVAK